MTDFPTPMDDRFKHQTRYDMSKRIEHLESENKRLTQDKERLEATCKALRRRITRALEIGQIDTPTYDYLIE